MKNSNHISRRHAVKSSIFGLLAVSLPSITYAKSIFEHTDSVTDKNAMFYRYPSIDDAIVSEVVGKSHFNLERVRELVDKRPELSRATWDWAFGDWESAIGAATHVGRCDIVEYLLSKGAKANIFTFTMLGAYETVKSMIEFQPGIQKNYGPHGISLLEHAEVGLRMKDKMTNAQVENCEKLIDYLKGLGDADGINYAVQTDNIDNYLGDYKYGEGENDGFSVRLNMRKNLALGRLGNTGGALYKIEDNVFNYNKFPSVTISFQFENDNVISLTVKEPELTLVAKKL